MSKKWPLKLNIKMNLRCLLGHDWEYSQEEVEFIRVSKPIFDTVFVLSEVRICQRCYKKQFKRVCDWENLYQLTDSQIRDKKISKLGIR